MDQISAIAVFGKWFFFPFEGKNGEKVGIRLETSKRFPFEVSLRIREGSVLEAEAEAFVFGSRFQIGV